MYKSVHLNKIYNSEKLKNLTVSEIRYIHMLEYYADLWECPGSPGAKTLSSQCREPGFDPWSGN